MIMFLERSLPPAAAARLHKIERVAFSAVIAGSCLMFVFNAVAVSYSAKAIAGGSDYIAALARNDTAGAQLLYQASISPNAESSHTMRSHATSIEVVVLFCVVAAFAWVGALCVRRFRSTNVSTDSMRYLQRQIFGTVAFVFFSFLLRAAFAASQAWMNQQLELNTACAACDACQSPQTLASLYMYSTPELWSAVVFVSSPLALLVALWGMTSQRAHEMFRSRGRAATSRELGSGLLKPVARAGV